MATQILFFNGKTKWAKPRKIDEKYDNYQVPLYLNEQTYNMFKESGLQLKVHEDADGKFVVFKRKHVEFNYAKKEQVTNGPVEVKLRKGSDYVEAPDVLIGNGSIITCKVEAYDTPKRGPGTKGHRLLAVAVEELVSYDPDAPKPEPETLKIQMPF